MADLLSCPFCGGENLEFYYADIEGWIAHVRCIECDDMIGPMSECKYDDKFEAAEDASTKWNRRTPSHDAETIKALEAKLTAIRNKIPMNYLRRHDVDGATGPTSECDIVAAMADYSADRWKYIDRVAAAEKSAKAMREALDECEAYFDNRSDVSDGDYGIPEPNEEMRLLSTVRAALAGRAS